MEEIKKYYKGVEVKIIKLKRCTGCKQAKAYDKFSKNCKTIDGLVGRCVSCESKRKKSRYLELKEATIDAPWLVKGPALVKYWPGVSPEQAFSNYEALLKDQLGGCGICGKDKKANNNIHLAVDHCHKTGKVRSLLCRTCNIGIGLLAECPEIIEKALKYIKKHRE